MTRNLIVMPCETGWNCLREGRSFFLPRVEGWTEVQIQRLEKILDVVVDSALDYRSYCA